MQVSSLPHLESELHNLSRVDTGANETIVSNNQPPALCLTLCIRIRHAEFETLLKNLSRQQNINACSLVFYVDEQKTIRQTASLEQFIAGHPLSAKIIYSGLMQRPAIIRDRFSKLCPTDWAVLLDSQYRPNDVGYVKRYIDIAASRRRPALYAGGSSLSFTGLPKEAALHTAYEREYECLDADERTRSLGPGVFETNLLVHKEVLRSTPFGRGFTVGMWDHLDWALKVTGDYRVEHVDNPVSKPDLCIDTVFLKQIEDSASSFASLARNHPTALKTTSLYRSVRWMSSVPFRGQVKRWAKGLAGSDKFSIERRLIGLRLYRAALYAGHI